MAQRGRRVPPTCAPQARRDPADLLARLAESPGSPPSRLVDEVRETVTPWNPGVGEGTRTPDFRNHKVDPGGRKTKK
jgi:hypothetical protein